MKMHQLARWISGWRHVRSSHIEHASFEEVERAERIFYLQFIRPGMVIFDVGAHIGDLTLMFSRFVGRHGAVHAFEPSPRTFDRLTAVCCAAGTLNVCVNRFALAEHTGTVDLHIYQKEYDEWNTRAVRPLEKYGLSVAAPVKSVVHCTTVDAYCEQTRIDRIDLLKIDVEGAELEVLIGAERMLRERRIRLLTFEFGQTTFDMGHKPTDIVRWLEQFDYQIENIVSTDPVFPGGVSVETACFSMHLATSRHEMHAPRS